jgi:hypothetical protein
MTLEELRGYDKRFREALRQVRFRPAVGRDGQPIAATFPILFRVAGSDADAS